MAPSAVEQRDHSPPPRVEVVIVAKPGAPAGRMLIPSPLEVEAVVRRIPEGRVLALGALRAVLARGRRADYTCPPSTDACLDVVARAAEEDRAAGRGPLAPYWRVVHDDGALIATFPGGVTAQSRALTAEQVVVLFLGKTPKVTEVSHFAWTPPPLARRPARQR